MCSSRWSSTGDDALAMSLDRVLPLDIQWIYLISDLVVLLISLTYIPVSKIIYSLLTVILSGQIIGVMQRFHLEKRIKRTLILLLWNQTERVGQRGMEISVNRQKAFITPQDFNLEEFLYMFLVALHFHLRAPARNTSI